MLLPLSLLFGLTAALTPGTADYECATESRGSICQPLQDSPNVAIGDHINLDLLATGLDLFFTNTTGISVALRNRNTTHRTQLTWNQRDVNGIEDGTQYFKILTSHNGGIFFGDVGENAFAGEGQFPCSLFDDNVGGSAEFDWLLTHYIDLPGGKCEYNATKHCVPILIDIPPLEEPRTILLKDNAGVCDR